MDTSLEQEYDEMKKRKKVRKDNLKALNRYNKWVDEVREKEKGWRPKIPEHGKRKPFYKSNIFLSMSENDYEKYPELKERMDEVGENDKEDDDYLGPWFK